MKPEQTISSILTCDYSSHREDFETCPHCGEKFENDEWDKHAVTLVTGPVGGIFRRLAVVSECPKCFEKSWVHQNFSSVQFMDEWPKKWRQVAAKEHARRTVCALREWGRGLCWRCRWLKDGEVFDMRTERSCSPSRKLHLSGWAETKCKYFKELRSATRGTK